MKDLIAEYADEIIRSHSEEHQDNPLFLYLPFQDVHSPLEVPQGYLDLYPDMKNKARQKFSGKMNDFISSLDHNFLELTHVYTLIFQPKFQL